MNIADTHTLWRRELLGRGLAEIGVDGEVGIRANRIRAVTGW